MTRLPSTTIENTCEVKLYGFFIEGKVRSIGLSIFISTGSQFLWESASNEYLSRGLARSLTFWGIRGFELGLLASCQPITPARIRQIKETRATNIFLGMSVF